MKLSIFKSPIVAGLILGIIGGVAMSLMEMNIGGPYIIIPYTLFLILAAVTIKLVDTEDKFKKLFSTGLLVFMVMTIILYLYIIVIQNPLALKMPFFEHAWRIGLMFIIGSAGSALVGFLVTRNLQDPKRKPAFKSPVLSVLIWGSLGGFLLIMSVQIAKGIFLFLIPYCIILILSLLSLNVKDSGRLCIKLFLTAFFTYAFMSGVLMLYFLSLYNKASREFPLMPYLKTLSVSLAWGALASATLAFLLTRKR
jgi:hypothetical protein